MNTNRSSYSLGAALGSAIVLALCAPAMAADIYDGGLKGGYDVPPPPTDRGIYLKAYVGQAPGTTPITELARARYEERTSDKAHGCDRF